MRLDPLAAARRAIGIAPLPGLSRRRRRPRADAPRTLVPELDPAPSGAPLSRARLDAARERLRAAIPPRGDDE